MRLPAALATTLVLCGAAVCAAAETFPNRPVRIVVPFTPGGTTDIVARAIGQELTRSFGQSFVIDNRPGAGGSIGAEIVAKAIPDGHTLLMGHIGTLALNPTIYPKLGYDPIASFAPVAWVARVPNILVVNAQFPARDVSELVAHLKARPGHYAYGSGGNGSAAHIAVEYFKHVSGTDVLHVPYKGTAPSVTDLIAGQIQIGFTGAPALMPHVAAGSLRALAISSPRRIAAFPDLPTVAESGYPGFDADQWYGVVAPNGTPADIVANLNAAINTALGQDALKTRLSSEGAEPMPATPAEFGRLIASEIERWRPILKVANVRIEYGGRHDPYNCHAFRGCRLCRRRAGWLSHRTRNLPHGRQSTGLARSRRAMGLGAPCHGNPQWPRIWPGDRDALRRVRDQRR